MKKRLFFIMLLVAILVFISFSTIVSSMSDNDVKIKDSPLYMIRTNNAIGKKLSQIFENIKTKFLGESMFFIFINHGKWIHDRIFYFTEDNFCKKNYMVTSPKLCTSECLARDGLETEGKGCPTLSPCNNR